MIQKSDRQICCNKQPTSTEPRDVASSCQALCIDKTGNDTSIESSVSEFKDDNTKRNIIGELITVCAQQKASKHFL